MLYLCGWISMLALVLLICAVSALCRRTFASLMFCLLLYVGPLAFMRTLLDALPMGRVNVLLHYICYGMPLSYPGTFAEAPNNSRALLTGILLTVSLIGAAVGARAYCRHQVGE